MMPSCRSKKGAIPLLLLVSAPTGMLIGQGVVSKLWRRKPVKRSLQVPVSLAPPYRIFGYFPFWNVGFHQLARSKCRRRGKFGGRKRDKAIAGTLCQFKSRHLRHEHPLNLYGRANRKKTEVFVMLK